MLTSYRVQLLTIILVTLTLLTLACGGKGQEIREMAAEKLEGVAEKLADEEATATTPTPDPEPMATSAPSPSIGSAPVLPTPTPIPTSEHTAGPVPTPTTSVAIVPAIHSPTPTASVVVVPPTPSPTATSPLPPDDSKIVFTSKRDGNTDIYVMNADGSGQTRLTDDPAGDQYPTWSPDGTKIAFTSNRAGKHPAIYVMNADGTGQTRLTDGCCYSQYPAWSPDGKRIAFVYPANSDIWVMNADGTDRTQLTDDHNWDYHPSWSPDGTKIAFASRQDGNWEIYVMNADGSGQTRLTDEPVDYLEPSWSPDGEKIAFISNANRDDNFEINVMNADGSGQTRLTDDPEWDQSPTWSPDGTKIVFVSKRDGDFDIYVMNPDGSGQTRLIDDRINMSGSFSWWSPLSSAVAPSPALIPASITVEPQSAEPGQVVTISGTGFQPYTTVHQLAINPSGMDSISVLSYPTPSTNAAGEFTTDMLIFSLPNGDHEVAVTVAGTSTTATFTVTGSTYLSGIDYPAASINVEPVSAAAGAVVTITGAGFPPFGLVQQLRLGGTDVRPAPQPHTDSAGNLETQIMIPQLGLGITQVEITIAGTSANTPITIGSAIPASITVEPQSAEPGQVVTITGSGFPPFTSMASFTLGGVSVLPPFPVIQEILGFAIDASGEFTTDVLIPSLPNGVHEVVVTVGVTSTAAIFTVTGSPN